MKICRNLKNEIKELYLFAGLCISYCVSINILFHTSGELLFRFFICQIFVVFLPGYSFVNLISFRGTFCEKISISYAIGYALNIIEYLIIYGLGFQKYAVPYSIVIAFISVILLLKSENAVDKNQQSIIDDDWYVLLVLFAVYLFVNIIVYSGNAISPFDSQGMTKLPRDVQFWCSNAVALKIGFPPTATYLAGGMLYYHYFSSLQIAYLSQVSGIDIFNLSFTLFPFGKCIILFGGLNYLINKIGLIKGKFFYILVILFMTGNEVKSVVTYISHTILGPFGFDMGYAFGMWFLGILIAQWKSKKFNFNFLILCVMFWITLTGTKTPIALVLIFAAALFCFIWLIRKDFKNAFIYGICIVGIFLMVSVYFSGAMRIATRNYEGASNNLLNFYSVQDILTAEHSNIILSLLHTIMRRVYYTQPVLAITTSVTSILAAYYLICKKLKWRECILAVVLLLITIIGLLMGIFIFAGGNSEMYFSMTAFIPCVAYNAELWENYFDKDFIGNGKKLQVCKAGALVLALLGIYNMLFNGYEGGIASLLSDGNKKIVGEYLFPEDSFSRDEALACIWIRDNTDREAIVINDRNVIGGKRSEYYNGIFSERQQYLEASDLIYVVDLNESYNNSIIDEISKREFVIKDVYSNNENAYKVLKNEGVDYIIQNNTFTPDFLPNNLFVELQYRAGDVSVYKFL